MSKRFDYVKYNETAANLQKAYKAKFTDLEGDIDALKDGRAKSLAMTALEECYMWVGKALRDQQVATDPKTELQEERNNE